MDQGPLVKDQIDIGEAFVAEFNKIVPVSSAFWLKESDGGWWYLYIASDKIDDGNRRNYYAEALNLADGFPKTPFFDPLSIKLVSSDSPVAREVQEMQFRYPQQMPTFYRRGRLGNVSIDEAYIYPAPVSVSSP